MLSEYIRGLKYYATVEEDFLILGRKSVDKDIRTWSKSLPSARLLTDIVFFEMEMLTPGAATILERKMKSNFNWLAMT